MREASRGNRPARADSTRTVGWGTHHFPTLRAPPRAADYDLPFPERVKCVVPRDFHPSCVRVSMLHLMRTAFLISAPLIRPTAPRAPAPLMVKFPESPKEVATEMSLAVQAALSDGKRRLEIALPDGLQFGLFGQPPGKQELGDPDYDPPAVQTQRADIELAYLAAEIFQKLGEGVACVLPDATALEQAERCWTKGGTPLRTRLVGSAAELDGKPAGFGGGRGAAVSAAGFGGGRGAAVSDAPLRVLLVLRAKKATLAALEPIVAPMGDEVLVLLLNPARLKSGGTRSDDL